MSQAGRYEEDPKTGKVVLVERTEMPPPRSTPRQPGEPAFAEPAAQAAAEAETTAFTPDVKAVVSPTKKGKE
jgi:hypothetical protein